MDESTSEIVKEDQGLERLNSLAANDAKAEFLKCCGSNNWARRMLAGRPFMNLNQLLDSADRVWWSLDPRDWLEAFQSHPKIGEKKAAAATAVDAQRWSEDEQSGTRNSGSETMAALAKLNSVYEEKFGYIFIVCASGKSAEEMLAILGDRLSNGPEQELQIAAGEQAKITQLRLKRLVAIEDAR